MFGSVDMHLMVLRALQLYKAGDVGGAAARLREISPSADDPFIATVHRLVQGISWMWLGDTGRAGNFWWKRPAGPKLTATGWRTSTPRGAGRCWR